MQGKVDLAIELLNYLFEQASMASILDMPITENLLDFKNKLIAFMNLQFTSHSAFFQDLDTSIKSSDGSWPQRPVSTTKQAYSARKPRCSLLGTKPTPSGSKRNSTSLTEILQVQPGSAHASNHGSRRGSRRSSHSEPRHRSERSEQTRDSKLSLPGNDQGRRQQELRVPSPINSRRESEARAENSEPFDEGLNDDFGTASNNSGWSIEPYELQRALETVNEHSRSRGANSPPGHRDSGDSLVSTMLSETPQPPAGHGMLAVVPMPPGSAPSLAACPDDVALSGERNGQSDPLLHSIHATPSSWLNLGEQDQAWDKANPNAVSRFTNGAAPIDYADGRDYDSDESMVEDGSVRGDAAHVSSEATTVVGGLPDAAPHEANLECEIADANTLIKVDTNLVAKTGTVSGSLGLSSYKHMASEASTNATGERGSLTSDDPDAITHRSSGGNSKKRGSNDSVGRKDSVRSQEDQTEGPSNPKAAGMTKRGTAGVGMSAPGLLPPDKEKRQQLPAIALTQIIGVKPDRFGFANGDDAEEKKAKLNRGRSYDALTVRGDRPLRRSMTQPLEITNTSEADDDFSTKPSLDKSSTVLKETRFLVPHRASHDSIDTDHSDSSYSSGSEGEVVRPGTSQSNESVHIAQKELHARGFDEEEHVAGQSFARRMSKFVDKRRETVRAIFKEELDEDKAVFLGTPSHRYVVHPSGSMRMAWDIGALVIILMESVILPLGLCFEIYPHEGVLWVSTGFFLPDIVLNFLTGFYHNGLLIMRQRAIIKHYLLGWFFIDFTSTVPWEALLRPLGGESATEASFMLKLAKVGKLMRVLRLLRVLKLKSLLERVEDMFSSYIVLFTLSITKTVAVYCLFCHWTACVWGWLGTYDGDAVPHDRSTCEPDGPCENGIGLEDSPWRRRYGLTEAGSGQQYLTALQFAAGLLTGAELPLSPGWWCERLFLTVMMIVSFLVCSMIISQIVVVMEKINQDNAEYLEQTRTIRDFMVSRGMPMRLQTKVRRYLEYQFKSRKVVHQNHEVMMKLSPFLRIEIQEHMNRTVLENHPFFAGMERSLLSHVCSIPHSMLYAPGDIVARKGQLCSSMCFILRGQLQIVDAREGFFIYIKAPAWTCDRGLFVTYAITHTINCSMHSELLTIRQQDLINLVNDFPSSQNYIKEYCQRVVDNDPSVSFCDYCRRSGHDLETCEELNAVCDPSVEMGPVSSHHSNATVSEYVTKAAKNGWRKILNRTKTSAFIVAKNLNTHSSVIDDRVGVDELTQGSQGIQAKPSHRGSFLPPSTANSDTAPVPQSKADALNAWGPY